LPNVSVRLRNPGLPRSGFSPLSGTVGWHVLTQEQALMAEPEVEAAWRSEFRRIRETKEGGNVFPDDPKAAFRWSGDEAEARRL